MKYIILVMNEKIKTADGTETFFNKEYKEAYHSTKAGAYTESLYKFVIPCKIKGLAEKGSIRILDVGFGLGYNVAVAISEAKRVNENVSIDIVSIEKDPEVFERIKQLNIPENLKDAYDFILSGKFQGFFIKNTRFYGYVSEKNGLCLKVILGEGRKTLKMLSDLKLKFDAVFYDAFSPKVNTEMWTVDIFRTVKNLMEEEAVFATYSASLAVRKGLIEAGFKIGLVEPVGRRSYSTVATIKGSIPPLTDKEKERINKSPYAVPYRDPELSMEPEEIKRKWEELVKKQVK